MVSSKKIFHANNVEIFDTRFKETYPYIVRKTQDNGIRGYIKENEEFLNSGNTLTFAQDTFTVFYQKERYFTGNKVKVLNPKIKNFNEDIATFIVAICNFILRNFTWGVGSDVNMINLLKIQLPTKKGEIDFEFMESFVAELEAQRVAELEAYLLATDLKDYKLTRYDEDILDRFDKLYDNRLEKNTDKIRLEDILDWQVGIKEIDPLKLNLLYQEGKKYPFYGQATENNGIINYVSLKKEVLNNKNSYPTILIHSNNQNIVYLDTPFYLKDGHGATSVLQNKNMTYKSALYFMGAIKKVIKERFDYNSKATKIGLKNTIIELPIDDKIVDYKFMEDFITVVQKLVIKDVVLYADKKIEATREVIER